MVDNTSDLEKATDQAPGLERFLRARLLNALTLLFLVLVVAGGTISASTPGSHFLVTASICLLVAAAVASSLVVRYFQLVRRLHADPLREIARLHKKRSVKKAGFVNAVQSSIGRPREHYQDTPENDGYDALGDVDVLGQKSADGVNRTDDPSRGPIE